MGHFNIVTRTIEDAGWYPFLSNLEDGYVIYHVADDVEHEVIYADWDLIDGVEHIRLIDPNADWRESELLRCDIAGSDEDIVADLENFFWEAADYLGA